jgi:hypothetical protein
VRSCLNGLNGLNCLNCLNCLRRNCPKREKWKPTNTAIPKEAQAAYGGGNTEETKVMDDEYDRCALPLVIKIVLSTVRRY